MAVVDVVLGQPWMESVGTVNFNVQNKFMKLWYKKKKITLHNFALGTMQRLGRKKHKSLMTQTHQMMSL